MVIALALGSALTFGAADFWGGLASRRAPSAAVVVTAQLLTIPVVLAWCLLDSASASQADLVWGASSGAAGAAGVLLLYKGLAEGRMSVVAPLTGLVAAGLPVIVSPLLGEVPSVLALVGIVIALAAIALVSREGTPHEDDHTVTRMTRSAMVAAAIGSGACFGGLFLLLDQASEQAGMWPLLANKITALVVVGTYGAAIVRKGFLIPRPAVGAAVACAVAGTAAEVLLLLSVQQGLVAVAAVVTSLYPGSTVLLARFVLHERLRRDQLAGFALAGLAVTLIASGGGSYAAAMTWDEGGPDASRLAATFDDAFDDKDVSVAIAAVSSGGADQAVVGGTAAPTDRFEIGSITKPLTATLAAVLAEEGTLRLTDGIGKWLDAGRNGHITIEQLATHTSGLPRLAPNYMAGPFDARNPYAAFSPDLAEEGLRTAERSAAGQPSYSNFGFQLLGLVLERASGASYADLLRTRLTEPLGLGRTGVRGAQLPGVRVTGRAAGRETPHWDQQLPGAGGIESSLEDMAALAKALLFPPDSPLGTAIKSAQQPRVSRGKGHQGLGWVIEPDGLVWHNGGTGGFNSELLLDHSRGRAVVLLANSSGVGDDLHRAGLLAIRGRDPMEARPTPPGEEWTDRAATLGDAFVSGGFERIHAQLAESFAAKLSTDELRQAWEEFAAGAGEFRRSETVTPRNAGGGAVAAELKLVHDARTLRIAVAWDRTGKIAGLVLLDEGQESPF